MQRIGTYTVERLPAPARGGQDGERGARMIPLTITSRQWTVLPHSYQIDVTEEERDALLKMSPEETYAWIGANYRRVTRTSLGALDDLQKPHAYEIVEGGSE